MIVYRVYEENYNYIRQDINDYGIYVIITNPNDITLDELCEYIHRELEWKFFHSWNDLLDQLTNIINDEVGPEITKNILWKTIESGVF